MPGQQFQPHPEGNGNDGKFLVDPYFRNITLEVVERRMNEKQRVQ